MRMPIKQFINFLLLGFAFLAMGSGGNLPVFSDGLKAYKSGSYQLAFTIWEPMAINGHTEAQLYLGNMFDLGEGVEKNRSKAADWYRLAAKKKILLRNIT